LKPNGLFGAYKRAGLKPNGLFGAYKRALMPIYALVPTDFGKEIVEGVNDYEDDTTFKNLQDIYDFEQNEEDETTETREDVDAYADY
jgi:hypothetical protein